MTSRAVAIFGAAVCSIACLSHPSTSCGAEYTARSTLVIGRQEPTMLARNTKTSSREEFENYKKTQQALLKSRSVLASALRKPEVAKLEAVRTDPDAVRWLSGMIKVECPDDSEIVSVSCTSKDPKEAQLLVKAVVDAYVSEVVDAATSRKMQRCSELEKLASEEELRLRRKLEMLNQLSATAAPDDAKEAKKPAPIDVQMLQLDIDVLRDILHEVRMEHERAKLELQALPRICVWEVAEEPLTPD
jgi:polysaccharide biosynthesis transport protein